MRFDRRLFVLFALMLAALSAVALHETFFALPECPDGGSTWMIRDGHWEGSKLVGAIFVWVWALAALWWIIGPKVAERGGSRAWLLPFWTMAILVLLGGGFYVVVLLHGALVA